MSGPPLSMSNAAVASLFWSNSSNAESMHWTSSSINGGRLSISSNLAGSFVDKFIEQQPRDHVDVNRKLLRISSRTRRTMAPALRDCSAENPCIQLARRSANRACCIAARGNVSRDLISALSNSLRDWRSFPRSQPSCRIASRPRTQCHPRRAKQAGAWCCKSPGRARCRVGIWF